MPDERIDRPPISSSRLTAADVARHTFATVRRGFEPHEVRAYLDLVARELQAWEQRDEQLREQLAAAEEAAQHPVIDEATLTTALGQQSALVLRNAHDEAARIMGRAEEEAQVLLHEAQQQARDLRLEAQSESAGRIAEAELAAGIVEEQSRTQADELLSQARTDGEELLERARAQGRSVLVKVQEARRDVLADLAQRRRALHLQIEQFRAARDELAATVTGVRDSVDTIVSDLAQADDRARAAASEVAAPAVDDEPADHDGDLDDLDVQGDGGGSEGTPAPHEPPAEATGPASEASVPAEEVPRAESRVDPAPAQLDGTDSEPSAVDELFARIRANQPDGAGTGMAGSAGAAVAAGPDQDAALLELRSSVLDPITLTLSRRLKRSLQDDQNRLLDRLRSDTKGATSAALPLPGERQRQAYVEAATPQLEEAFAAGAAFAHELSASAVSAAPEPLPAATLADELAAEMVATLRRRLSAGGDRGEDPIERVRAAYREWRGERIERLVGDVALGAFSAGVLAGTGEGGTVRWLLARHDGGCADCDDNSLADPLSPGAEFPTGHRHPPIHAGCRCLVAPTTG